MRHISWQQVKHIFVKNKLQKVGQLVKLNIA